jgi:hypothetical protein
VEIETGPTRPESEALTDGSGGCQTVAVRIERKRFGAVFSSAVRSPYNKRTIEAGLWGIWAFGPDAESVSYVLSTWWSSSNPPFRTNFYSHPKIPEEPLVPALPSSELRGGLHLPLNFLQRGAMLRSTLVFLFDHPVQFRSDQNCLAGNVKPKQQDNNCS